MSESVRLSWRRASKTRHVARISWGRRWVKVGELYRTSCGWVWEQDVDFFVDGDGSAWLASEDLERGTLYAAKNEIAARVFVALVGKRDWIKQC